MKKSLTILLVFFAANMTLTYAQNSNSQSNNRDEFKYKKLKIVKKENEEIPLAGVADEGADARFASFGSDIGIGETQGNLSVSLTGGANYDIPISVPPGLNGVVPEITLSYNSQSGNGIAGYGWNIGGVSTISRIPSTNFHDGQVDGVDFDNLDRFALDGERLVLQSGTYGTSGAQYQTENFSNIKITSHGTSPYGSSYGPSYFLVQYPDGSKAYYGNSTDSRSYTGYAITYWENPQGVRISYEYTKSYNSQSISKIKYGGTYSSGAINEIRFIYSETNRDRYEQAYINNISIVRKNILNKIEVYGNGTRYRYYSFIHDTSSEETKLKYDRLHRITEYSGDGTQSHSQISFTYTTNSSSVSYNGLTTDLGLQSIEQRNAETISLDLTGNGKMDFIVVPKNTKTKFWMFTDIQSGSYNYPYEVTTGTYETIFPTTALNYQNKILSGQGLSIVQNGSGGQVNFKMYSKAPPSSGVPVGYDYTKTWNSPTYNYQNSLTSSTQKAIPKEYISGDFNGDGLTDVLAIGKPYTNRYCYEYECPTNGPYRKASNGREECLEPRIDPNSELFTKNNPKDKGNDVHNDANIKSFNQERIIDDCGPGGGGNTCYSCGTYNVNYKGVYLIDLNRNTTSNFAKYAGTLQLELTGEYKLQTGDFNGDGKTDLLHITNGKLYVYTLGINNSLTLLWETTDSGILVDDPLMLGDYNGDGKTDFMDPVANNSTSFKIFISTGVGFFSETRTMPFTYRKTNWNPNNGILTGYNLIPLDINGDGTTDIIDYTTTTTNDSSNGTQEIKIYANYGLNLGSTVATRLRFQHGGTITKSGNLKHYPIPIFLTSEQPNKNLDFASISDQWVTSFSFQPDHREDVLIRSITNNGVRYNIEYGNIDPSQYNSEYQQVYQPAYDEVYPNVDLTIASGTKVVTILERKSSSYPEDLIPVKQIYRYQGAVFNTNGLGFQGFKAIARSNWHTGSSDRIYTVSKYDPDLRGTLTEEYSQKNYFSFTTPSSNYIGKTTYQHGSSISANKVFKLWTQSRQFQSELDGSYINSSYTYNSYNNVVTSNSTYLGGSTSKSITYANNTGSTYYIGRPTNITTAYNIGVESFTTEEQLTYTGYLLTQKKVKANNMPFDQENYVYDTFGNLTKKVTKPYGETAREVEFQYDTSGRFLLKSIDVDDMETSYQYNNMTYMLQKETNAFGQETNFSYDKWNRLISLIDYLGNESVTLYVEDSKNNYTVTSVSDDGSSSISIYDKLKRVTRIKEKDLFGNWVSVSYEYDAQDRVIRESEPYSGESPSLWNEIEYDVYGRPVGQSLSNGQDVTISYNGLSTTVNDGTKTVTSTKNGLGLTTSVTDPGGTINYSYFGNGNLKSTDFNGSVILFEQDGWGRRTKLTDPSAGIYEYSYNGFGEIVNETNPKGQIQFTYSSTGKILEKEITGDHTDMRILYTYDPITKTLSSTSTINSDGNNTDYFYNYDSNQRLTSVSEINSFAEFTNTYTYDSFGRIDSEKYYAKLLSNSKSSTKKIRKTYQNGYLKSIKDFNSNNNIFDITSINERGQVLSSSLGSDVEVNKSYNQYGYLTSDSVKKSTTSQILMNLTNDFNSQKGLLNSRTNSMFSWSETFGYDNLDRLISFDDNDGDNNLTFDSFGRINTDNSIGNYNYSGISFKANTIDLNIQGDLYYQQNSLEQIKYNAFKKPHEIDEVGKEKIGFQYNAFMGRASMFYGGTEADKYQRNNRKHYSADGKMEISYDAQLNETKFITYIGGDAYSAPAIWKSTQGTINQSDFFYLHRDYLGSILLITDGSGSAKEKRHFDAWGNIVRLADGNDNPLDSMEFLDRGYTGHEHLQGIALIHMNGRIYDPKLKRFLSPDNFIQDMGNTQNFNRYTYVLNNPLKYVDPSGETGVETAGALALISGPVGWAAAVVVASAAIFMKDLQIGRWIGRNLKSAARDIGNGIREVGRFFRRLFGGKKKSAKPIEYSNFEGLSSDPLAGPSTNIPSTFFSGVGSGNTDLGISRSNYKTWILEQAHKADMFAAGFRHGFFNGAKSTWNFVKSLGTAEGWKNVGQGIVNLGHLSNQYSAEGMMLRAQMASNVSNYVSNIPSMSAYEIGHDVGFGTEKIVETVLVSRGAGMIANATRTGTQGGLNLFKWGASQTSKNVGWKTGDYMLNLPNKGTPRLNWKANYGALRREMGFGKPIYDSYRTTSGNLIPTGGFLNAERYILRTRGWNYSPNMGAWLPPGF